MHAAIAALRKDKIAGFNLFWIATLILGAIFIVATAREWHHLIYQDNFTIQTNLFGTTYYSLVGLHASHVTVGLIGLIDRGDPRPGRTNPARTQRSDAK